METARSDVKFFKRHAVSENVLEEVYVCIQEEREQFQILL